jgi:hypothetical protein
MKRVLGEDYSGNVAVKEEEQGDKPKEPVKDKDGELKNLAKELEELKKKNLNGTHRGEGGGATFGGGGGGGGGGGAPGGIWDKLIGAEGEGPEEAATADVDPLSTVIRFCTDSLPWICSGVAMPLLSVDNANIYIALAALASYYLKPATGGRNNARPIWLVALQLLGINEKAMDAALSVCRCLSYVMRSMTLYMIAYWVTQAIINAVDDGHGGSADGNGGYAHSPLPPPVDDELTHEF